MTEPGSSKHGPLHDDEMKHDTEGLVRSGRSSHVEEWTDPEPAGEDQPDVDYAPDDTLVGGTPQGIDAASVAERSDLARYLSRDAFPGTSEALRASAASAGAPENILAMLDGLDGRSDRRYHTVQEVWDAVGGGHEERP